MFGCTVAQGFCLPAFFIWLFSGGILAIFFVLSAIEFWRTGTS